MMNKCYGPSWGFKSPHLKSDQVGEVDSIPQFVEVVRQPLNNFLVHYFKTGSVSKDWTRAMASESGITIYIQQGEE